MTSDPSAIAARLAVRTVRACEPVRRGGNARVYRVETENGTFALKGYPDDGRSRAEREWAALTFLASLGVDNVPRALARECDWTLLSWIDGTAVGERRSADLDAMLEFAGRLDAMMAEPSAAALPIAAEAVFAPADLRDQVERRFARLLPVAEDEPALASFLRELRAAWESLPTEAPPLGVRWTLSPSDFGTHNAVRRHDGTLAFLDFEYFGRDDAVKLTADVLWHPAMQLEAGERARFVAGARALYGDDPTFEARLRRDLPAYGVRWALIVLNEFLRADWERRVAAGRADDRGAVRTRQLALARALLERVHTFADSPEV